MAEALMLARTPKGALAPTDDESRAALLELGEGEIVLVTIAHVRNPRFHRKALSMLQLAFKVWNPGEKSLGGMPAKKSFKQFRKEVTIAAGYYDIVIGLDGQTRLEAQSLSYGKMDQKTFEEVYDALFAVLTQGTLEGIDKSQVDAIAQAVADAGY